LLKVCVETYNGNGKKQANKEINKKKDIKLFVDFVLCYGNKNKELVRKLAKRLEINIFLSEFVIILPFKRLLGSRLKKYDIWYDKEFGVIKGSK